MNTEKWNTKKQLIVAYVENTDVGGFAPIVMGTVALVDEAQTDESRQTLVESIRAIFKTIDPNKVNLQDLFNSDHMANLLTPHGKSKDMGDLFSDSEEYAQYESKRFEARLNKWYRSKIWDGTLEGLQTLNFPSMEVEEEE